MHPVRAALTFQCFFTVALTGRVGCWYLFYPGRCPGLWKTLGFQPVLAMYDIGLSCSGKRQSQAQPVSSFLYKHWTEFSCLHHSKYRMSHKYTCYYSSSIWWITSQLSFTRSVSSCFLFRGSGLSGSVPGVVGFAEGLLPRPYRWLRTTL